MVARSTPRRGDYRALLMRRALPAFLLAGASALSLLGAPVAAAGPRIVEMRALSYSPTLVTFPAPGRAIEWRNVTSPDRLHDAVSSLPGFFSTGLLASGQAARVRFGAAGTFTYICSIHDVM